MASRVFYRKWRPQSLSDVVGQEPVTRTLLNALAANSISHAYLFCGPRGTGKTSTGRILAKAVNCLTTGGRGEPCNACAMCQAITEGRALDVIEIDAASNRSIDDIRELREKVGYAPGQARYKVYIIDEVHGLSKDACNALLKTLEEPPPHAIFVLATTEAHKIIPTILSRCQRFDFRRISQADVVAKLAQVCAAEDIHVPPEILRLIARATTGSLRDAENLLQQLVTFYGNEITLPQAQVVLGVTGDARARQLVAHILSRDVAAGIATINGVNRDGIDLRQFNRELVEYLRALLLIKVGSKEGFDLTPEDRHELEQLAAGATLLQALRAVKQFGSLELGLDGNSTLPLELALVDCALAGAEDTAVPPPAVTRVKAKPADTLLKPAPTVQDVSRAPAPTSVQPADTIHEKAPKQPEPVPVTNLKTEVSAPVAPVKPMVAESRPEPIASPPTTEIEKLKQSWPNISIPAEIIKNTEPWILRTFKGICAQATPQTIEADTIVLSFASELMQKNIEKPHNQKIAECILSGFLGRPCKVQAIYQPGTGSKPKPKRQANPVAQQLLDAGAEEIT